MCSCIDVFNYLPSFQTASKLYEAIFTNYAHEINAVLDQISF
jgi:hypothetical protein